MLALSLPAPLQIAGAIAGFAAVLGLAVLALLYFAQARELKRLREWAGDAPERSRAAAAEAAASASGELPRVRAAPQRAAVAARPAPARDEHEDDDGDDDEDGEDPPRDQTAAAPALTGARTNAPAGTGGPALASATPFPGLRRAPAAEDGPAGDARRPPSAARSVPPPLTTAGARPAAANGNAGSATAPPVRRPPPPPLGARPAAAARAAQPARAGGGAVAAGIGGRDDGGRPRWLAPVLAGLALLAVAGAAFGAVQLLSGGDGASSRNAGAAGSAPPSTGTARSRGASFSNGSTTVAVLNGTPVAGLAKQVAKDLLDAGFKQGTVTNASDQARAATIVSFLPGQRGKANAVRKVLSAGSVEPIDPTTKAIACVAPSPCPPVVVTVGADRNR